VLREGHAFFRSLSSVSLTGAPPPSSPTFLLCSLCGNRSIDRSIDRKRQEKHQHRMKVVGIAIVRTGSDLNEPIPLTVANDLSSFGFFQRQVRTGVRLPALLREPRCKLWDWYWRQQSLRISLFAPFLSLCTQSVKEMLLFLTKTFLKRTEPGQRQSVEHEGYVVHCYVRSDGLAGTVTTDQEYPARVAFGLLGQLIEEFTQAHGDSWKTVSTPESVAFPQAAEYLEKYQDPASADKVTKIQKDLDETTQILHKTIDSVLERGVKLDNLVDKSNDLSAQSKLFYKQAKKTNSCCVVS
jgi:synaptobrevin homolog YKT6